MLELALRLLESLGRPCALGHARHLLVSPQRTRIRRHRRRRVGVTMGRSERRGPPPPSDAEQGVWQGKVVARRFVSPDGMTVLVGKSASENDVLSLELAEPHDFWFHVAADSGSHVVVRNPEKLER